MGNTPLLDSDALGTCEGITIKKKIISRLKETKKISVLILSCILNSLV